eukprot:gene4251-8193_t
MEHSVDHRSELRGMWSGRQLAVLDRYHSSAPCNGCKPAASVSYSADAPAADVAALEQAGLTYDLGDAVAVGSAALVTDYEHSCMLLGPSR